MVKKSLLLIFIFIFSFTFLAIAQGMGMEGHGMGMKMKARVGGNNILPTGKWWKNPNIAQKLNLSEEQVNKIDSIFLTYMDKLIDLKAQLEKKELLFKNTIVNDNFDRDKVLALFDDIAALKTKIKREGFLMKLDIRDQLTPEQRAQLKTMRKELKKRMWMKRLKNRREGRGRMRK